MSIKKVKTTLFISIK